MNLFTRRRSACAPTVWGLVAMAAVLLDAGCSKTVTYTYVDVHVTVDPQTITPGQLATVVTCEFQVLGADATDGFTLKCPENDVRYDVGTFNWTSNAASGNLQFRVRLFAVNRVIVGEGTSEPISISRGKRLATEVLVLGVPPTTGPDEDGGIDGGVDGEVDGGVDTGPDDASSTDAPVGETGADQNADQSSDAGMPDGTATDTSPDGGPDSSAAADAASETGSDAAADGLSGDGSGDAG
jgi:hypothetical protein